MKAVRLFQNAMAGAALTFAVSAGAAFAVPSVDYQFSQITGNTNTVNAHVVETSSNVLTFTLTNVDPNPNVWSSTVGEFRAFYFNVANDSLLSGVVIAGADVTSSMISAGAVNEVGGDSDTRIIGGSCPGPTGCLFDVGVEFGTAGAENPLILSTTFTYTRAAGGLSLASFFPTTGNVMAVRMKPFADGGSSKDVCNGCSSTSTSGSSSSSSSGGPGGGEVPEPGALGIFGLGLAGLGFMARRRKLD